MQNADFYIFYTFTYQSLIELVHAAAVGFIIVVVVFDVVVVLFEPGGKGDRDLDTARLNALLLI